MKKPKAEFWSNVEYTGFMPRIVRALCVDGFDARQRYLISHSAYRGASGTIGRLWLRFQMYGLYPLYLVWRLIFDRKPATLIVSTNTFYAPAVALLFRSKKNHTIIHLVYDLFPESLVHAGITEQGSLLCKLLDKLQAWTLRKADANVFLGQKLQDFVLEKNPAVSHPTIIPVGANEEPFAEEPDFYQSDEIIHILYCGNMGYMHDPKSIAAVINDCGTLIPEKTKLDFHANGKGYADLKSRVPNPPAWVGFSGFLADQEWADKMKDADIALIIMGEGAENILMPSKTYSALVAGQAILAITPGQSDLARLVYDYDCGWVVPPGNADALQSLLESIIQNPSEIAEKQKNAWNCGHEHFSGKAVAAQWKALLG